MGSQGSKNVPEEDSDSNVSGQMYEQEIAGEKENEKFVDTEKADSKYESSEDGDELKEDSDEEGAVQFVSAEGAEKSLIPSAFIKKEKVDLESMNAAGETTFETLATFETTRNAEPILTSPVKVKQEPQDASEAVWEEMEEKNEPAEETYKENQEIEEEDEGEEMKKEFLVWNPFTRLKRMWRKNNIEYLCDKKVKVEPLRTQSPISPVTIKQECGERYHWAPQEYNSTPLQALHAIKEETQNFEEEVEKEAEHEKHVHVIKKEIQSAGKKEAEDYQSLSEVEMEPPVVADPVVPEKITILENIVIVQPPSPPVLRKRKTDSLTGAQNCVSEFVTKKLKTLHPRKRNRKPQGVRTEQRKPQQLKHSSLTMEPKRKVGRPRTTEASKQQIQRRLFIKKLFGGVPKQNSIKKKQGGSKKLKKDEFVCYINKESRKSILKKYDVITRSKKAKLKHRNNIETPITLGVPKPFKTESNNYELIYPVAEMIPQPISVSPCRERATKIKNEMLCNSNKQPQLRLVRVPVKRLMPLRSGGFYVPYQIQRALELNKSVRQVKKLKPANDLSSIKLENKMTIPLLHIENVYSLNPVVRLTRVNPNKIMAKTLKKEPLNCVAEELPAPQIKAELFSPLENAELPTPQIKAEPLSPMESYSSMPPSSADNEDQSACDNDDSGISMGDCDGHSDRFATTHNEVLMNMALDEALVLEIANQRAHINNCLLKFGFSPVQFNLYNSMEELKAFLDLLLVK